MVSKRLGISTLVAIAALAGGTARAADYSQPLPPQQPIVIEQPPQPEFASNWYLRGFVGIGINGHYDLDYIENPAHSTGFAFQNSSIADSTFLGGGVGYEWNNWLRFDVTAEYRAKSRVYAIGTYPNSTGTLDVYEGNLSSWVFLANAFVDLGTWNCFTPFVGFGVGGARVSLSDFSDTSPTNGYGFGRNPSQWNFAWALHAGVAYTVSKNLKVELAYRYLNYGSITDTVDCSAGCTPDSYKFDHLYSHDIMLGLRWTCCETAPPPPRYVYTPPPPVYVPPPPLRSKG
jgi:opacity protein-like surface antigen